LSETPAFTATGGKAPLKVAWITYFPIEWLTDLPPALQGLPRLHPATWQRVLWQEFQKDESLELHIVVLRKSFPTSMRFRRGNTTFHCVKTIAGTRGPTLFWFDTILVNRVLKTIQPDLVHAWGSEYGAAAIAGRLRFPALVTMQGILTWLGEVVELSPSLKLSRFAEPGSLRKAHVVTCESSFAMKYLKERYPHLRLLQVEHAPSPAFSDVLRNPQSKPLRIMCVGAFDASKGANVAIEALAGLVNEFDFEVLWIGSRNRELEDELTRKVGTAIWERITFRQQVPSSEIAQELARTTIFLHAALADNSPNAVKEAVVAGVPVVATRTGGIPDYIVAGKNGFLFESGNAEDCRQKLKAAMTDGMFGQGRVDAATLQQMRSYLAANTMAQKFREAYGLTVELDPRAKGRN
jgi:glycosyltransferase involved in cell wall biosynthesis